jgi:hypothetical protein
MVKNASGLRGERPEGAVTWPRCFFLWRRSGMSPAFDSDAILSDILFSDDLSERLSAPSTRSAEQESVPGGPFDTESLLDELSA